ncbi:hypothetical protein MRY87_05750 [bacterium]|nr:hypothetical protein [bacterium]
MIAPTSRRPLFSLALLVGIALLFLSGTSGCTKSNSDDSDEMAQSGQENSGENNSGNENEESEGLFRTDCGTPLNGTIENPVSSSRGIPVRVEEFGTNGSAIVFRDGGRQLVRLRAISEEATAFQTMRAERVNSGFPRSALLFTDDCPITTSTGALGIVGDLLSANGRSLTESLLTNNAASVDPIGSCDEALVAGCYEALIESSAPELGAVISNFLWKPRSERNGNLVILFNPGGATVIVNGETLENSGASNGRGTTARSNKSGGAFGRNVEVQAFDRIGRALVFPNGETTLIIRNGSSRVEL